MSHLQQGALLRLVQILGNPKTNPPIAPLIPVSRTTWYDGIKSGRFPTPVKIGPRISAWRASDILALVEKLGGAA